VSLCVDCRLTLAIVLAVALAPAHAQDREREALRRAQQMISRLQQDNAALQREKAELEQRASAAEAELKAAKAQADRLRRTSGALRAAEKDKAQLESRLAQSEARLKDTVQQSGEQIAGLRKELQQRQESLDTTRREGEETSTHLSAQLAAQTGRADACEQQNAQLYAVTMDLIARYRENRGAWEKFLLSEPFTGLKSVEVENLLDDMRGKAKDHKIEPAAPASPAIRTQ
jgi:predicted  nucleic acid-binding Zn-ribbon protein